MPDDPDESAPAAPEVVELQDTGAASGLRGRLTWDGAPGCAFELEITRDGRLLSLRVDAPDGGTLGSRLLREVPVGEMERALRRAALPVRAARAYRTPLLTEVDSGGADAEADLLRWRAWSSEFVVRPRPGAAGRGDRPYAAVAACYVAAFERGEATPARAVAAELGFEETAVRNYLTKARERGLLTSAVPGRPGGQLTDKARGQLARTVAEAP